MGNPLDEMTTFDPKHNSFGFVRIAAALAVIVSHSFDLGGFRGEPVAAVTHGQADLGSLAVAVFFVVSGFLITRSYLRSRHVGRYLWHRALRILPGFWVCLLVTVFGFGLVDYWVTHGTVGGYFHGVPSPLGYLRHNGLVDYRQGDVAGVFAGTRQHALNGSLWTLIYEVRAYFLIAALGVAGILRRWRVVVLFVVGLLWASLLNRQYLPQVPLLPVNDLFFRRLTLYFFCGAAAYLFRDILIVRWQGAVAALAVLVIGAALGVYASVEYAPVAYLVLWVGIQPRFAGINARTDLSYGAYIYAWPVQQTLVAVGLARAGLAAYLTGVVGATLALAWVSWKLVERPMLALKEARLPFREGWRRAPSAGLEPAQPAPEAGALSAELRGQLWR